MFLQQYTCAVFNSNFSVDSVAKSTQNTHAFMWCSSDTNANALDIGDFLFWRQPFSFLELYQLRKPVQNCFLCFSSLRSNKCVIPYKICIHISGTGFISVFILSIYLDGKVSGHICLYTLYKWQNP
jgi:hypothetical protein